MVFHGFFLGVALTLGSCLNLVLPTVVMAGVGALLERSLRSALRGKLAVLLAQDISAMLLTHLRSWVAVGYAALLNWMLWGVARAQTTAWLSWQATTCGTPTTSGPGQSTDVAAWSQDVWLVGRRVAREFACDVLHSVVDAPPTPASALAAQDWEWLDAAMVYFAAFFAWAVFLGAHMRCVTPLVRGGRRTYCFAAVAAGGATAAAYVTRAASLTRWGHPVFVLAKVLYSSGTHIGLPLRFSVLAVQCIALPMLCAAAAAQLADNQRLLAAIRPRFLTAARPSMPVHASEEGTTRREGASRSSLSRAATFVAAFWLLQTLAFSAVWVQVEAVGHELSASLSALYQGQTPSAISVHVRRQDWGGSALAVRATTGLVLLYCAMHCALVLHDAIRLAVLKLPAVMGSLHVVFEARQQAHPSPPTTAAPDPTTAPSAASPPLPVEDALSTYDLRHLVGNVLDVLGTQLAGTAAEEANVPAGTVSATPTQVQLLLPPVLGQAAEVFSAALELGGVNQALRGVGDIAARVAQALPLQGTAGTGRSEPPAASASHDHPRYVASWLAWMHQSLGSIDVGLDLLWMAEAGLAVADRTLGHLEVVNHVLTHAAQQQFLRWGVVFGPARLTTPSWAGVDLTHVQVEITAAARNVAWGVLPLPNALASRHTLAVARLLGTILADAEGGSPGAAQGVLPIAFASSEAHRGSLFLDVAVSQRVLLAAAAAAESSIAGNSEVWLAAMRQAVGATSSGASKGMTPLSAMYAGHLTSSMLHAEACRLALQHPRSAIGVASAIDGTAAFNLREYTALWARRFLANATAEAASGGAVAMLGGLARDRSSSTYRSTALTLLPDLAVLQGRMRTLHTFVACLRAVLAPARRMGPALPPSLQQLAERPQAGGDEITDQGVDCDPQPTAYPVGEEPVEQLWDVKGYAAGVWRRLQAATALLGSSPATLGHYHSLVWAGTMAPVARCLHFSHPVQSVTTHSPVRERAGSFVAGLYSSGSWKPPTPASTSFSRSESEDTAPDGVHAARLRGGGSSPTPRAQAARHTPAQPFAAYEESTPPFWMDVLLVVWHFLLSFIVPCLRGVQQGPVAVEPGQHRRAGSDLTAHLPAEQQRLTAHTAATAWGVSPFDMTWGPARALALPGAPSLYSAGEACPSVNSETGHTTSYERRYDEEWRASRSRRTVYQSGPGMGHSAVAELGPDSGGVAVTQASQAAQTACDTWAEAGASPLHVFESSQVMHRIVGSPAMTVSAGVGAEVPAPGTAATLNLGHGSRPQRVPPLQTTTCTHACTAWGLDRKCPALLLPFIRRALAWLDAVCKHVILQVAGAPSTQRLITQDGEAVYAANFAGAVAATPLECCLVISEGDFTLHLPLAETLAGEDGFALWSGVLAPLGTRIVEEAQARTEKVLGRPVRVPRSLAALQESVGQWATGSGSRDALGRYLQRLELWRRSALWHRCLAPRLAARPDMVAAVTDLLRKLGHLEQLGTVRCAAFLGVLQPDVNEAVEGALDQGGHTPLPEPSTAPPALGRVESAGHDSAMSWDSEGFAQPGAAGSSLFGMRHWLGGGHSVGSSPASEGAYTAYLGEDPASRVPADGVSGLPWPGALPDMPVGQPDMPPSLQGLQDAWSSLVGVGSMLAASITPLLSAVDLQLIVAMDDVLDVLCVTLPEIERPCSTAGDSEPAPTPDESTSGVSRVIQWLQGHVQAWAAAPAAHAAWAAQHPVAAILALETAVRVAHILTCLLSCRSVPNAAVLPATLILPVHGPEATAAEVCTDPAARSARASARVWALAQASPRVLPSAAPGMVQAHALAVLAAGWGLHALVPEHGAGSAGAAGGHSDSPPTEPEVQG